MNKFTLIALFATAFAQEKPKCATAEELMKSDFAEYKLKYKFTADYNQNKDWTNGTSIGFDSTDEKTCGDNYCYIQTGRDTNTTFTIKGFPNDHQPGFRIYSQDKSKVFSFNQGAILTGTGYYMFDVDKEYMSGGKYYDYTLLKYKDAENELARYFVGSDGPPFYAPLGVNTSGKGTQIFRTDRFIGANPTKFCFVKVEKPTAPIDDLVPAHKKLDAKVSGATCATAEELMKSDFAEYKLKYKFTADYKDYDDLIKGTSVGFDSNDKKTCGDNYCYIQTGRDNNTTFTIKGFPNDIPAGFRIYSQDKSKVFSFNQGAPFTGFGYYMFDVDKEYISGGSYYYYTLLKYKDAENELTNAYDTPLGVDTSGKGTQIFNSIFQASPTKFCFVKVEESSAL